ncbi:PadR family transcriptional regulator [Bacillus massiliigorillae]|uniref:PadR family transcriptional regulator n=1 Tax=Bacillus massiliigorillae TaxID=1243664 RepID=UPI0003A8F9F7|nr:PadR family transcriptional regulator [Bacillus massiliigorillae]
MSLQIFILGVLSAGNHHPYDIKKMFKKNNIDELSKISDGTLYYNFESLLKQGCIEKIEVIRDENRPDKTTYGITAKGREALEQKIYNSFKNYTSISSLFSSTIFLKYVDTNKVAFLLEEIINKLKEKIERYDILWDEIHPDSTPAIHLIQSYTHNQMKVDLEWLERLLLFVRSQ